MPSLRGGARNNSGRKLKSLTRGRPGEQRNQPSFANFFESRSTQETVPPLLAITQGNQEEKIEAVQPVPEVAERLLFPNFDADLMNYENNQHAREKN